MEMTRSFCLKLSTVKTSFLRNAAVSQLDNLTSRAISIWALSILLICHLSNIKHQHIVSIVICISMQLNKINSNEARFPTSLCKMAICKMPQKRKNITQINKKSWESTNNLWITNARVKSIKMKESGIKGMLLHDIIWNKV